MKKHPPQFTHHLLFHEAWHYIAIPPAIYQCPTKIIPEQLLIIRLPGVIIRHILVYF